MTDRSYHSPRTQLPPQSYLITDRSAFTSAYAVLPAGSFRDIVASRLPGWDKTRVWILACPLSGFAQTFAQYIVEVAPGGGSTQPEVEDTVESVLFLTEGALSLTIGGKTEAMVPGGYAFIPPACDWSLTNRGDTPARFHWIRKAYEAVDGIEAPTPLVSHERAIAPEPMPQAEGRWTTTRFVEQDDLRHDMHVNIVTLRPGAVIPFAETHVMEHGIYVLQGKAVYRLNQDWVEVQAGDFIWLRAFCPQACCAAGPDDFRYLLYKNVNRQIKLSADASQSA